MIDVLLEDPANCDVNTNACSITVKCLVFVLIINPRYLFCIFYYFDCYFLMDLLSRFHLVISVVVAYFIN